MGIIGIEQPSIITIDQDLRLRKYNGQHDFALPWYQDTENVWMIDGDQELYTPEYLGKMYAWWSDHYEVYFIEILEQGHYKPIGDVSFGQDDMPILMGEKQYRGRGIAKKVISTLIERAKELGFEEILIEEIYSWNTPSQNLFTSLGFKAVGDYGKGMSYRLAL